VTKEKNIKRFDHDVLDNSGYLYTATKKISCRIANQRLTDVTFEFADFAGKRVIDVGCGDGTYTLELFKRRPKYLLGIDASQKAVEAAYKKAKRHKSLEFRVEDIYDLVHRKERFDIAVVRGLLHHLYDPQKAVSAISKVAKEIIVIEPNGFNPVLKLIEKFSRYHVEHEEKSYLPFTLDRWFKEQGGKIEKFTYCGLVPFFCPDGMARVFKRIEPVMERLPLFRQLTCAVYVVKISMD